AGRIDCGIATRSVAKSAGLDFLPLTWERFDLVLRQRDYFMKGPQVLFDFMRSSVLRDRAAELGGYDVSDAGAVRLVNQARSVLRTRVSLRASRSEERRVG